MAFKIYTKTGDSGQTGLLGGKRVSKDHLRIEAYGTVDELNSHIGLLRSFIGEDLNSAVNPQVDPYLATVQSLLFTLGSQLATPHGAKPAVVPVSEMHLGTVEKAIDRLEDDLKPLSNFILPAGSRSTSQAHVCRTVTRRAERRVVSLAETADIDPLILQYLNRLSDYFFTLSRALTAWSGGRDSVWTPQSA